MSVVFDEILVVFALDFAYSALFDEGGIGVFAINIYGIPGGFLFKLPHYSGRGVVAPGLPDVADCDKVYIGQFEKAVHENFAFGSVADDGDIHLVAALALGGEHARGEHEPAGGGACHFQKISAVENIHNSISYLL